MPRALVIDDAQQTIELLTDRLASMGHECDTALCQEEAEGFLRENVFDYILLDLQIPLKFQGPADKEYGKNLLRKIREMPGHKDRPVIVITAYAEIDGYRLGIEIMKCGATDFVGKPFNETNNLENAIREALAKCPPLNSPNAKTGRKKSEGPTAPFTGGFLDFYEDRVELCGVRICGPVGGSQARKVLDLLRDKSVTSDRTAYDQNFIMKRLGFQQRGQQAVGDAVRTIRTTCRDALLKHRNLLCNTEDVIVNRDRGYHFSELIRVRDGGVEPEERAKFTEHQLAIVREIRAKSPCSRKHLGDRLKLAIDQLEREIEPLIDQKVIARIGSGAAVRYKLLNDPRSTDC